MLISTDPADGIGFGEPEVGLVIGGTGLARAPPTLHINQQATATAEANNARTPYTLPLPYG